MNVTETVEGISRKYAGSSDDFISLGVKLALKDKKRQYQLERLEILARYDVTTVKELKEKIKNGSLPEHPAWEDLIEIKNVEAQIREIKDDIDSLSAA